MQVIEKRNRVESYGESTEAIQFGIVASAKAIEILSSGLYNDKIKAVIRELSTNAYDSHVENGNEDTPFDVTLPNSLNPNFVIRDYGVGLSPSSVRSVYTQYFASNKTESNDYTGCLGLGSKSPFAYTDNFMVESFYEGIHYTYFIYKNEENMPVMDLKCEAFTSEPNGVRITIAVKPQDIINFRDKASEVFVYFKTIPNITGQTIHINKPDYLMEGDGWKIRSNKFRQNDGEAIAIMGNIGYPIDFSDENLNDNQRALMRCPIDIEFNIGELNITASREALGYDKRTMRAIARKLNQILVDCEQIIVDTIEKAPSLWDARVKFKESIDMFPNGILKNLNMNIDWNGKKLFSSHAHSIKVEIDNCRLSSLYVQYSSYRGPRFTNSETDYIYPSNKIMIVEQDAVGSVSRAKLYIETQHGLNPDFECDINLVKFEDAAARQEFLDLLGIPEGQIVKASSLPKATVVRGTRTSSGKHLTPVSTYNSNSGNLNCWDNSNIDLSEGGIFVDTLRGKVKRNGDYVDSTIIKEIIRYLENCSVDIPVIYGIKKAVIDKAKQEGDWVDFFDWVNTHLTALKSKYDVNTILSNHKIVDRYDSYYNMSIDNYESVDSFIVNKDNPFSKALAEFKSMTVDSDTVAIAKNIQSLAATLGTPIEVKTKVKDYHFEQYFTHIPIFGIVTKRMYDVRDLGTDKQQSVFRDLARLFEIYRN